LAKDLLQILIDHMNTLTIQDVSSLPQVAEPPTVMSTIVTAATAGAAPTTKEEEDEDIPIAHLGADNPRTAKHQRQRKLQPQSWFSEVKAIRWSARNTRSTEESQIVIPVAAVFSAAVTDDAGRAKRPRPTSPLQSVSRRLLEQTCWDSTSARKIFVSREDDASEGVREVIEKRLALLSAAHYSATGYKSLVEGHDPDDLLSNHDVYVVRLKAQYLYTAFSHAN
jgi:hypothetical protein